MPKVQDYRNQSDFSINKGVNNNSGENEQLKAGAKDSIGRETNSLVPMTHSTSIGKSGPFGGENKFGK